MCLCAYLFRHCLRRSPDRARPSSLALPSLLSNLSLLTPLTRLIPLILLVPLPSLLPLRSWPRSLAGLVVMVGAVSVEEWTTPDTQTRPQHQPLSPSQTPTQSPGLDCPTTTSGLPPRRWTKHAPAPAQTQPPTQSQTQTQTQTEGQMQVQEQEEGQVRSSSRCPPSSRRSKGTGRTAPRPRPCAE
jgi:hypothetical protein